MGRGVRSRVRRSLRTSRFVSHSQLQTLQYNASLYARPGDLSLLSSCTWNIIIVGSFCSREMSLLARRPWWRSWLCPDSPLARGLRASCFTHSPMPIRTPPRDPIFPLASSLQAPRSGATERTSTARLTGRRHARPRVPQRAVFLAWRREPHRTRPLARPPDQDRERLPRHPDGHT